MTESKYHCSSRDRQREQKMKHVWALVQASFNFACPLLPAIKLTFSSHLLYVSRLVLKPFHLIQVSRIVFYSELTEMSSIFLRPSLPKALVCHLANAPHLANRDFHPSAHFLGMLHSVNHSIHSQSALAKEAPV